MLLNYNFIFLKMSEHFFGFEYRSDELDFRNMAGIILSIPDIIPGLNFSEENRMINKSATLLLAGAIFIALSAPVFALPGYYDGLDSTEFINEGRKILTIDYIGLWDNGVYEDGTDFPYGDLWIYIYEPDLYRWADELEESDWNRRHEIDRFRLPGQALRGMWLSGDEVTYINSGVYDWREFDYEAVVFRVVVIEPSADWDTDTLM